MNKRQFEKIDFHLEYLSKHVGEEEFAYQVFSARVWLAEQYLIRAAGVPLPRASLPPGLPLQTSPRP